MPAPLHIEISRNSDGWPEALVSFVRTLIVRGVSTDVVASSSTAVTVLAVTVTEIVTVVHCAGSEVSQTRTRNSSAPT